MVAGAIPGRTRTLAVGIYTLVETGREEAAWGLLLISALLAFGAIYLSNRLVEPRGRRVIDLSIDITMRQDAFVLSVRDSASVEVLGLFGPSGSGKTSLLEAIAGIRTPDAGEIRIGDRVLFSSAKRIDLPARDRRIGYVPQDALLFPNMNVTANITYGSRCKTGFDALVQILDLQRIARSGRQQCCRGARSSAWRSRAR